jgi:hypothetical protein
MLKTVDPGVEQDCIAKLLNNYYLMFTSADFKFNDSNPAQEVIHSPLYQIRKSMVAHYQNQTLDDLNITTTK